MNHNDLSDAFSQLTSEGEIAYQWAIIDGDVEAPEGATIPSGSDLKAALKRSEEGKAKSANREAAREALKKTWKGLPDYIQGPYQTQFVAANVLLDESNDLAAIAMIQFEEPKKGFDDEQVATFDKVKAALIASIEKL